MRQRQNYVLQNMNNTIQYTEPNLSSQNPHNIIIYFDYIWLSI